MMRSYVLNGLNLSAAIGTAHFKGLKLVGWDGGAASNLQLAKKPTARGAFRIPANPTEAGKTLTLTGTISAASAADTLAAIDALNAAVTLGEFTLSVTDDGSTRSMSVSRQDEVHIEPTSTALVKTFGIVLAGADPRKFGSSLSANTGLASTSGGLTYPITYPITFTGTTTSGSISLTNNGNTAGKVALRIDGNVTNPVVTQTTSSGRKTIVCSGLTIASGRHLDIDCNVPSVLLDGQSYRKYVTTSQWFDFEVGANTFDFSAASSSGGALLTATVYPAWM